MLTDLLNQLTICLSSSCSPQFISFGHRSEQDCILTLILFKTFIDYVLDINVDQSRCRSPIQSTRTRQLAPQRTFLLTDRFVLVIKRTNIIMLIRFVLSFKQTNVIMLINFSFHCVAVFIPQQSTHGRSNYIFVNSSSRSNSGASLSVSS